MADSRPTSSEVRTICVQPVKHWHCFEGHLKEIDEKRGGARMGLSERYDTILSRMKTETVRKEISETKSLYKQKVEEQFCSGGNLREAQIESRTLARGGGGGGGGDQHKTQAEIIDLAALAEEFKEFFTRCNGRNFSIEICQVKAYSAKN